MDDDLDLGSVLELSRRMDDPNEDEDDMDEDGSDGGNKRKRDPDAPNELGVFAMFAETIPESGEGERPATVRGMIWRIGLLLA